MARQVKVVPPEQLRKDEVPQPVEPTLESRVSGLEYRASHPNLPNLAAILNDPENGTVFRLEFQRCCVETGIAFLGRVEELEGELNHHKEQAVMWDDATPRRGNNGATSATGGRVVELFGRVDDGLTKGRQALVPEIALAAEKESRTAAVIWGALLGAALALAVLAVCNPAAFHRPRPADFSTEWKMQTVYPATQPPAAVRESSTQPGTLTLAAPISGIEITPQVDCWVSVKDATGKTWVSQTMEAHHFFQFNGEAGRPLEVRSGCPGQIMYRVDGAEVNPVNHSGKPEQSEVVSLP